MSSLNLHFLGLSAYEPGPPLTRGPNPGKGHPTRESESDSEEVIRQVDAAAGTGQLARLRRLKDPTTRKNVKKILEIRTD